MPQINGLKIRVKRRRGRAIARLAVSARWIAQILGACSPSVMWRVVTMARAMARATTWSNGPCVTGHPTAWAPATSSRAIAGSASQPRIRLDTVMPNWQADR